ncbi:MAG: peptidoglycan-binding domain-containing protein [Pseudomonas sp.]|nr:peptidoglycan-binding domain-containing protein [Pseudomonas sp.]
MFDFRSGWLYTALLGGFSICSGFSGLAFAQSGEGNWLYTIEPQVQLAKTSSSTVLEVQRELNDRGYSAGLADGLMGARTRAAILAYQRSHGLLDDGNVSSTLLTHLRAPILRQDPAAKASMPEAAAQHVTDIQQELRRHGYRVGRPSALLTDEIYTAIHSYESDHGLLKSGEPSAGLLRHMRAR